MIMSTYDYHIFRLAIGNIDYVYVLYLDTKM